MNFKERASAYVSIFAIAILMVGLSISIQLALTGDVRAVASKSTKQPCLPSNDLTSKDPSQYYTGPMIDSHFHIPPPVNGGPHPVLGRDLTLADIACTLKSEGTSQAFSFFPVYPDYPERKFIEVVEQAKKKYPKLFVRFLMPPGVDDNPPTASAKVIKKLLKGRQGLFQGYGEIGLYEIKGRRGADQFPPDAPIFQKIYPVVRKNNLLVYLHPGIGHEDNLERVLQQYPQISFIVHGEQIESVIGDLMSKYSNVYFTVNDLYGDQYLLRPDGSKSAFLAGLKDYGPLLEKDVANWKQLIEAHPDQFIWGTDRGDAVWTFDRDVGRILADYGRNFIARLDPAVQRKFAYQNAQRLLK